MADDSMPESERKFLHALDCNIPIQRHYAIEFFEQTLDRLFEDYEVYLRTNLLMYPAPMLYLNMTIRKFSRFNAADYTPPSVTYEALEAAGLTIYDIDSLINEWQHLCMIVEDSQGCIVLKPKKRHRDGNSAQAVHLCNRVFPFAEKLIREHIENHEDADEITDCFDLLAGLFCRSYQWLTIQKTVAYLNEVVETHINGSVSALVADGKGRKVVYQPFKNFGYRLADSSLLQQLYRLLNRQFDFIHPEQTTPEDFAAVLSARRLDEVQVFIHFACETTQVAYILTALQPYFQRFSFQNIERSGRFLTHLGRPITANNLSKSKSESPKEKDFIDNTIRDIFKGF